MTEPYLATLNPEQRHAVEHSGDQPLLIITGAGSGKTNTLAHRVAHLIVQRADPPSHDALDVFTASSGRDEPPCRAHRSAGVAGARAADGRCSQLVRNISCCRCQTSARVFRPDWSGSRVHDP